MRELLSTVNRWLEQDLKIALGTVVKTYGSAPRGLGAKMVVNQKGEMIGSVSGGCVEGAVVSESITVITTGQPKLLYYGVTRDQAISVGLACGGEIQVYVQPLLTHRFRWIEAALIEDKLAAMITVLSGKYQYQQIMAYPDGSLQTDLEDNAFVDEVTQPLPEIFKGFVSQRRTLAIQGDDVEIFYDLLLPAPKIIIVGAVHIAIPLVHFANALGFHTIVLDPRKAFATQERFGHAKELIRAWPQDYLSSFPWTEGTCLVTVSHDEKLDLPALVIACRKNPLYIGALGSQKTFGKYKTSLLEMGIDEDVLGRIHSPVGLAIGARGPEEIALAIIAQIVAVRNGKAA